MSEMKSLTLNGKTYDSFVDPVARQLSEALAVISSASGENIVLSNASGYRLPRFSIYGKTTQDGTPTPSAPVELVSVGDGGSITVNVMGSYETQSMTITTPNGLPGIPVASGGNYTDENGQQWVCNEIDLARGKLIVRVFSETITGNHTFKETADYAGRFVSDGFLSVQSKNGRDNAMSNFAKYEAWAPGSYGECFAISERNLYYYPETEMTADEVTAMFANMIASKTPPVVIGQMKNPMEIDLTEEEIAAYAELHTYRNNTTISNDVSAYMELEYVMDAKKYIDYLVGSGGSGGAAPAKLANVTLLASAWKGSDSLYSQVVTIAGVTPYSKVDLLPSVGQLAVFYNKDVTFMTENDNGVVTVYAIGEQPTNNYTMQVSITEVIA